ncbi:tetratricopeptide repeat protein [Ramlibacter sp. XY19]|uniref:tetratricopeptide repeat protein n=1 Tax=Ramlibacter paludis TaxID=2908000 RepID=UPI0023D986F1|nr:tetratricopeptide repeat protein [Ramlibacter paludis]MCG2592168.1 tetratricopeptide repeat protein [Ramlibacter paludis]
MTDHLHRLAQQQLAQGHVRGAVETLRQLLAHDPQDAEAHALLALALYNMRRLHAARYEAGTALALAPESVLAHYALGIVETADRKFALADEHFQQALALEPRSPHLLRARASLYRLWGRKSDVGALLEEARAIDPGDPVTLVALGEHALEENRLDEARRFADAALRIEPESADGLVLMGAVLLRQGIADDAREHALQALRIDATHRGALQLLAGVKARKSPLLGLWWRYSVWMESIGTTRSVLVLLLAYATYRVLRGVVEQGSLRAWAMPIEVAWLAIVAYSWIGPGLFRRSLDKELQGVKLGPRF